MEWERMLYVDWMKVFVSIYNTYLGNEFWKNQNEFHEKKKSWTNFAISRKKVLKGAHFSDTVRLKNHSSVTWVVLFPSTPLSVILWPCVRLHDIFHIFTSLFSFINQNQTKWKWHSQKVNKIKWKIIPNGTSVLLIKMYSIILVSLALANPFVFSEFITGKSDL